jgi:diaminopimelate epimerase
MTLKFVKMHGIGNDYVYLDAVTEPVIEDRARVAGWREFVGRISDRHKGIGSDGVILVCRPAQAKSHVRMRMFNADGSESEMCGNGVRCVAKFAHDRLGVGANPMRVETGRGVLEIAYRVSGGKVTEATANMGHPEFELRAVPVDYTRLNKLPTNSHTEWGLEIEGRVWAMCFVSMGNPHAVAFVESVDAVDLERIGPLVESHPAFPNRVNFHVAEAILGPSARKLPREVRMRTWERGSGITQACGTGACAVYAAGVKTGRLDPLSAEPVTLHLPGGSLRVGGSSDGRGAGDLLMTGPASDICEGIWLGE